MTVPPVELDDLADPTAGFPQATRERWRALALGVLRKTGWEGTDDAAEDALSTISYDGVRIAALYDASDLPDAPRVVRGPGLWDVRQRHADPDPAVTREAIHADLENGVTSLWLDLTSIDPAALPAVLDGVLLDLAPVVLDAGPRTAEAAEAFLRLAGDVALPGGNLGADPIGLAARTGAPAVLDDAVSLARRCATDHPGLRAITVDALPYHDAGGADADELGCSIATGVAYLRALTGAGLPVEQALGQIEFRYAATADQFLTIAKLRAARRMWARVAEVAGGPGRQLQHAVTSSAMMTVRDPWVNMLRTTLACFAAGTGGADAVTVQPFDACLGLPDAFARRIARNTQALLVEEAGVARVADPAGGSWYVERLTDDLARRAWEWFQEIERSGGMAAALERLVPERLAETRAARAVNIAHRRDPITGVSEFPDLGERPVTRRPGPGLARTPGDGLPLVRHAEEFEALRDLADAQPSRPTVFLATIGPIAAHTARATFAANLFAAGGIATVAGGPGTDPAAIAAAFRESGAPVACLCSSDRLYGEHAAAVAAALREAGAQKVWLAGKGEYEGVDANVYAGCDALGVLRTTFDDLGVSR
ncbi:methylmalonyl-CoA mutase [Microbispora triticiradicis]|uniref:methylmalonyl-CoA mutase n=1 Tax=Microbispora triticiradicis TaxID=2200763 RepID=A0ABX9LGM8_9ACTN|nr:methylmalonyl-CoA mutase family protein [Microbispora triticiradicis]RGA03128.1 methylmalonyl-CoA mutase [Microbispora triticiradicis]GLW23089.1 methylmalonyl-CoA mutase [Microbispora amethystogenes]